MGRCLYCKQYAVPDLRILHNLPKSQETRNKWIKFMGFDETSLELSKYALLCSDHFDVDCYQVCGLKLQLMPGSCPTEECQMKDFPTVKKNILQRYKEYSTANRQSSKPSEDAGKTKILSERNANVSRTFPPGSLLPPILTLHHDHSYIETNEVLKQKLKRKSDEVLELKRASKNLKAVVDRRDLKISSLKEVINVLEHSKTLCRKGFTAAVINI